MSNSAQQPRRSSGKHLKDDWHTCTTSSLRMLMATHCDWYTNGPRRNIRLHSGHGPVDCQRGWYTWAMIGIPVEMWIIDYLYNTTALSPVFRHADYRRGWSSLDAWLPYRDWKNWPEQPRRSSGVDRCVNHRSGVFAKWAADRKTTMAIMNPYVSSQTPIVTKLTYSPVETSHNAVVISQPSEFKSKNKLKIMPHRQPEHARYFATLNCKAYKANFAYKFHHDNLQICRKRTKFHWKKSSTYKGYN